MRVRSCGRMRNRPGGRWGFKNEAAERDVGRVYRIGRLLRRAQRHIVVGCACGCHDNYQRFGMVRTLIVMEQISPSTQFLLKEMH
jgi:hypothetical protein